MPRRGHLTAPVEHQPTPDVGGELIEVVEGQRGSEGCVRHLRGHNSGVPLNRMAWLATVAICVIAAVLVLANGYVGYFFVLLAVGASAAVNLR